MISMEQAKQILTDGTEVTTKEGTVATIKQTWEGNFDYQAKAYGPPYAWVFGPKDYRWVALSDLTEA